MMKKKVVSLAVVLIMLLRLLPASAANAYQITVNPISIEVGGQEFLPTDVNGKNVPVFEYGGTTYAPLRALAEAYGLTVGYDQSKNLAFVEGAASTEGFAGTSGTARALTQSTTITVQPINIEVGGEVFRPTDANGKAVEVFVYEGTTYAPLRALAEAYGLLVGYDAYAKLAFVTDGAVQDINAFIETMETQEEGFDALVEYLILLSEDYHFEVADASYDTFADGSVYWMVGMNLMGHTPTGDIVTPWSEVPCDIYVQGIDDPALGYNIAGYYDYDTSVFYMRDDNMRYDAMGFSPEWLFDEEDSPSDEPDEPSTPTTPSVPSDGVIVANPIDVSTGNPPTDGTIIPDLMLYADGNLSLSIREDNHISVREGSDSDWDGAMKVVEAYIDLLCDEFGFEVVAEESTVAYYGWYDWAYGLNSTNIAGRHAQKEVDGVGCDLNITGSGDGESDIWIYVNSDIEFEFADTGHRYGGEKRDMSYAGPSAGAGLIKNADGSYSTDDGRLTAAVGEAHVIRDGVSYKTTVERYYPRYGTVCLVPHYRGEYVWIFTETAYEGDVFGFYELAMPGDNLGIWAIWDEDEIISVSNDPDDEPATDATLRFLYEEDGVEVYYAYVEFAYGEPRSVEALIVVDTNVNSGSSSNSSSSSSSSGGVPSSEDTCTWCSGSGEEDCFECDGDGDVSCGFCHGRGETGYGDEKIDCPRCDGMGDEMCDICLGSGTRKCSRCGGDGVD